MIELFQLDSEQTPSEHMSQSGDGQLFLTLSAAAVAGTMAAKTMYMIGSPQGQSVKILVDLGSSNTFLSAAIADKLSGIQELSSPISVKVANGSVLSCSTYFPSAAWSVQGYTFTSDLKVLPLASYDMILGLDWLEQFSPMQVHWSHKRMTIPYGSSTATLYGQLPTFPEVLHIYAVEISTADTVETVIPAAIQQLIDTFATLFEVPQDLPPQRAYDHSIPLVPGAAPFCVRPYRFAPHLKDEIEKQIKEMLQAGLIQKSSNPFSSSVLLVKKKDNSWRFCVDYRHLNAITPKGKYPVPIIDEFLDELSHASWFSCLDLRSGFHQIWMKVGKEFKTAFQTHCGQFEFRVMPFGLTGAPGTFQDAMNTTLAPYLRKFVLVFFYDILIYSRTLEDHNTSKAGV